MKDEWDEFVDKLNDLEGLDGRSLDSLNSNIPFSPFQKLSSTPEEALDQAKTRLAEVTGAVFR